MKTEAQKAEFVQLRAKGISFYKCAEILNISKPTLLKWGQELELDIKNEKALYIEALKAAGRLSLQEHIGRLVKRLESVSTEIDRRHLLDGQGLADLPLAKLYEIEDSILDGQGLDGLRLTNKMFNDSYREDYEI